MFPPFLFFAVTGSFLSFCPAFRKEYRTIKMDRFQLCGSTGSYGLIENDPHYKALQGIHRCGILVIGG